MGIVLEVIEWFDPDGRQFVHRILEEGSADIKMGAQLIVRESQAAVFFRDGKGLDVLGPGRHTLSTMEGQGARTGPPARLRHLHGAGHPAPPVRQHPGGHAGCLWLRAGGGLPAGSDRLASE